MVLLPCSPCAKVQSFSELHKILLHIFYFANVFPSLCKVEFAFFLPNSWQDCAFFVILHLVGGLGDWSFGGLGDWSFSRLVVWSFS